jgi:hypothetical protein
VSVYSDSGGDDFHIYSTDLKVIFLFLLFILLIVEQKEANLDELTSFEEVCSNPNYITHYTAHHTDFSSTVIVVLWRGPISGPAICHDGKPVLYVHQSFVEAGEFSSWNKDHPHPPSTQREYLEKEIEAARHAQQVISRHQSDMFANHSNLVAIHSSESVDGMCIEFVVVAKHFLPVKDKKCLPREIEGIRTKVSSGWVELSGRKELQRNRPLLPGTGIGIGHNAHLNLAVYSSCCRYSRRMVSSKW